MTAPLNLDDIEPVPVDIGVPDHRASSGEKGERPKLATSPDARKRPGIFGAPRESTRQPRKSAKPPVPKLTPGARKAIERIYLLIGGFIQPMNEVLGETIIERAPMCADSVYELAQQNEDFRRALQLMMTSSLTGAVIFAHLPILMAVVATTSKSDKAKMMAAGTLMAFKMGGDLSTIDGDQETESWFESEASK